jgi:hypothetical protein
VGRNEVRPRGKAFPLFTFQVKKAVPVGESLMAVPKGIVYTGGFLTDTKLDRVFFI